MGSRQEVQGLDSGFGDREVLSKREESMGWLGREEGQAAGQVPSGGLTLM